MNKQLIFISGLFVLGAAAGAAIVDYINDSRDAQQETETHQPPIPSEDSIVNPMASSFMVSQASESERIQLLEQRIESLTERIEQLAQQVAAAGKTASEASGTLATTPTVTAGTPVSRASAALTTENLVKAGITEMLADDIIRRKNEIDLQTLELRDRAVREGFLGTSRYTRELNALLERDVSLRDEIGDTAYDRYLYASGQANRVNVASVMQGSPADQAGIQSGDLILNYGERQMFNWNELQDATTRGERGEYVNVAVLRNGQLYNFWVPRGPLGVRLGSKRVQP